MTLSMDLSVAGCFVEAPARYACRSAANKADPASRGDPSEQQDRPSRQSLSRIPQRLRTRKFRIGRLGRVLAQVADHAGRAKRFTRDAVIASVQDQPVVRVL